MELALIAGFSRFRIFFVQLIVEGENMNHAYADVLAQGSGSFRLDRLVRTAGVCEGVVTGPDGIAVGTATLRHLSGHQQADTTLVDYVLEHTADLGSEVAPVLGALVEQAFADGSRRVELRCSLEDVERARAALGAGMRYEGITREPETLGRAVFSRLSHDVGTPIPPCFPELQAGGLSDGVVRLRVTHPEDARALYEEQANPEAKRFALVEPLTEWDIAEKAVRARMEWLTGPQGLMTIVDAATGQPAGKLALRSVVPPKVADVGYGVLPAYRGRGFAARALKLATTWALRGAGYSRLELGVKPENQASLAVALAAGYLPDGVRSNRLRNLDGTFSDEIHFAATESALNLVTYA